MIRSIKNFAHLVEAKIANLACQNPGKKLFVIGVTGTDGKTTTASLIYHILNSAGKKTGLITTIGGEINGKSFDTGFHTTTPSSFALQKLLKLAVKENVEYLVLEVTSHALDQNRVEGINFKIAVLTNITHEHLDYHKTYENYIKAKSKLFRNSDLAIINADDSSYAKIKPYLNNGKVFTYSLDSKNSDLNIKSSAFVFPSGYEFNLENFLAAVSVAKALKINNDIIQKSLLSFKLPEGRQEVVYDGEFKAIIDFAHTPNSFENILPEMKKEAGGRLIHVFGSAGKRDKSKRPFMGSASSKYSDIIILTAEDPRGEKIDKINSQIKTGIKNGFSFAANDLYEDAGGKRICFEVPDRGKAIEFALKIAQKGDVVVVTGKGHEKSMNLGNGEISWSDHKAVEKALRIRSNV